MSDKRFNNKFFLATLFYVLTAFASFAGVKDTTENKTPGEYSLVLYAGGGLSFYASPPGVPLSVPTKLNRIGVGGTLRVMWHPDHLLRLGVETGRIPFYSYSIEDNISGELRLTSIPLILEWSMPITKRINVFLGYGLYLLESHLDYAGETVSSSNSLGYLLAVNYIQPISTNFGLAGEIKWMNANETKNDVVNIQLQLVWKFFKW